MPVRSRLRERGLLVSTDRGRQMLTVRRTLEGSPRQVLHLMSDLVGSGAVAGPTEGILELLDQINEGKAKDAADSAQLEQV